MVCNPNGTSPKRHPWQQWKFWCRNCGCNLRHNTCKYPKPPSQRLPDWESHLDAMYDDPQGGNTTCNYLCMKWCHPVSCLPCNQRGANWWCWREIDKKVWTFIDDNFIKTISLPMYHQSLLRLNDYHVQFDPRLVLPSHWCRSPLVLVAGDMAPPNWFGLKKTIYAAVDSTESGNYFPATYHGE